MSILSRHRLLAALAWASCVSLAWASAWAGEGAPSGAPAARPVQADASVPTSLWDRTKEFFSPTETCPHCGGRFAPARSLWMLLIGFAGQILFTSRFLVQWIASERRKESYIPLIFWYLSIIGSVLLLVYALSILAWPIILGQVFGILVYVRNLVLIARVKEGGEKSTPKELGEGITASPWNRQDPAE
ncbi:MAG: lipid-A-disaccharide synthase N-terminal domain-containing protein [Planctomycetota bacterium]